MTSTNKVASACIYTNVTSQIYMCFYVLLCFIVNHCKAKEFDPFSLACQSSKQLQWLPQEA